MPHFKSRSAQMLQVREPITLAGYHKALLDLHVILLQRLRVRASLGTVAMQRQER